MNTQTNVNKEARTKSSEDVGIPFGIGCINFVPKATKYIFSLSRWADDVRESLAAIPSISNVRISLPSTYRDSEIEFDDDFPTFEMGGRVLPCGQFGQSVEIQFSLYVPRRIQAEILEVDSEHLEGEVENFNVFLSYQYSCPVAFFYSVANRDSQLDGSDFVVICRKFLSRCLVPRSGDTFNHHVWREGLWARFYTAAPARRRWSVERYSGVKKA